jgi:two-component system phosphate regulon sensor histidine kinase PhoR
VIIGGVLAWLSSLALVWWLASRGRAAVRAPAAPESTLAGSLSELRADRDLMGRILETMREGVLVLSAKNRIVLFNQALREMLFLTGDFVGRPLIEIIRSADLQSLADRTRALAGKAESEFDLGGVRPRRLSVQAIPLVGESGGILLVVIDVTEMRRLETLRRDFVANVSHELKTPVTAIRSAAETLRDIALKDPEHAVSFVDMIERNAARLQDLVEDLLELSRIESRALQLRLEPLALAPVAQSVLQLFAERAGKKRIALEQTIPPTLTALADARALEQVLSNLVDNAVKYCPPETTITIAADGDGAQIRLQVADHGSGIEAKHLPRLFERFYRVDAGRSREVGGTGLGLSIVKHLVEAMSGAVSVESELGRGTTFVVTLPAA